MLVFGREKEERKRYEAKKKKKIKHGGVGAKQAHTHWPYV